MLPPSPATTSLPSANSRGRWFALLLVAAWASSLVTALPMLAPLSSAAWLRQPLQDDAYYFLVIARNLAHGEGFTVGGQQVTGFQPMQLGLGLFAGWTTDWGQTQAPAVLALLGFTIQNVVGLGLLLWLWRRIAPRAWLGPLVSAVVWAAHPFGQRHALNGMETALALTAWLAVCLLFDRWRARRTLGSALALGLGLGAAFLARNDAVMLAAAVGVLTLWRLRQDPSPRATLLQLAACALGTLVVASPWLLFNLQVTGSIVPHSGAAEFRGSLYDYGRVAQLEEAIASAVKNLSPLPIPLSRVSDAARLGLGLPLLLAVGWLLRFGWRRAPEWRPTLELLGTAFLGLFVVYAGLFGAPHMLPRWLAPGVVICSVMAGVLAEQLRSRSPGVLAAVAALLLAVVGLRGLTVRQDAARAIPITNTWVMLRFLQSHPPSGRLGALQSGLLAWNDARVENLDGKVNPRALVAWREHRFARWLADGELDEVLDQSLLGLDADPAIRGAFDLQTPEPGLIRLVRRGAAPR